ncbi:MAG: DMT family transporter, partial [Eggerthellaceae bacterium]|nr:DMT family transporter [Eggerthellaceae bacterium]
MRYKVYIIIATLAWGSSFVVTKDVSAFVSTAQILLTRFTAAIPIVALVFHKRLEHFLDPEHVWRGLVLGCVTFLAFYFQVRGLTFTTPGKNAFLTSAYCIIVPFLVWAMFGRKPTAYNIVAALLCIVGVGFISLDDSLRLELGDSITLIGSLFYALQFVLLARFSRGRCVFTLTIWYFVGTSACSLATMLLFENPVPPTSIPVNAWLELAHLAVVVTAMALVLQNLSLAHLSASTASLLSSLECVFAVLMSIAVGAEMLTPRIVTGFI